MIYKLIHHSFESGQRKDLRTYHFTFDSKSFLSRRGLGVGMATGPGWHGTRQAQLILTWIRSGPTHPGCMQFNKTGPCWVVILWSATQAQTGPYLSRTQPGLEKIRINSQTGPDMERESNRGSIEKEKKKFPIAGSFYSLLRSHCRSMVYIIWSFDLNSSDGLTVFTIWALRSNGPYHLTVKIQRPNFFFKKKLMTSCFSQ